MPEPLTTEDLARIERFAATGSAHIWPGITGDVVALIAEVRRLQQDSAQALANARAAGRQSILTELRRRADDPSASMLDSDFLENLISELEGDDASEG